MPRREAPTRLSDRKRLAILDAAIAEFRADGYEATSMDRIAARAAVSKRTVYNHFASKDLLFTSMLLSLLEQGEGETPPTYRRDVPVRRQLTALVQGKLRLLHRADFIDLARVAITAGLHSPGLARLMVARLGEREAGLTSWIRAAAADGRLRIADPAFAAQQLESLVKGMAFWPQVALGQPPLSAARQKQVIRGVVDMFLAQYAVPPPAA